MIDQPERREQLDSFLIHAANGVLLVYPRERMLSGKRRRDKLARDLVKWTRRTVRWPLEVIRPVPLANCGIAAHRGASATHPENTLAAFRAAVELGVQQIELDIRQTKDHKLIVMHDKTLDRTTSGQGLVKEHTLSQIRQLDAGTWKHSRFAGERVPTLADAMRQIPRNIWINLHVKGPSGSAKRAAWHAFALGRTHQVVLAVRADAAQAARSHVPMIKICSMDREGSFDDYVDRAITLKANFVQVLRRDGVPSAESVERAHRGNLKVNYCTARDRDEVSQLFKLGIDFPMMDDPSLATSLEGGHVGDNVRVES